MLAEATAADEDAGRIHAHGTGNGRSGDDVAGGDTGKDVIQPG
jgi:hypothetical protein